MKMSRHEKAIREALDMVRNEIAVREIELRGTKENRERARPQDMLLQLLGEEDDMFASAGTVARTTDMGLSCECGDFEPGDLDEWWYAPSDYSTMPERKRRARCVSCKKPIENGATVTEFERRRHANGFEYDKLGLEEVPLAPYWMCETCSDIYFSLVELGFCMNIAEDSMQSCLRDYQRDYGPFTLETTDA